MIDFDFKKNCYGCGLCKNICPKNSINMCENSEGFLNPKIDKNKCINSIGVAIQDYKIDVEVDENTPISKIINIKDKIANSVGRYIVDNKDRLDIDTNSESFNQFLESENHLFCDIAVVGNSIKFNL